MAMDPKKVTKQIKKITRKVLKVLESSNVNEIRVKEIRESAANQLEMELLSDPRQNFVTSLVELYLDELEGKKPAEAELQEAESEGEEAESKYCQSNDDVFICRLSSMERWVTVGKYRGKPLVSLREWFVTADGTYQATTKGISLDAAQWKNLKNNVPKIEDGIKKMQSRRLTI